MAPNESNQQCFGRCALITTTVTSPQVFFYADPLDDKCYVIENELFSVEKHLSKCNSDTNEYDELMERGERLREEWKRVRDQMTDRRPAIEKMPGYSVNKCVVHSCPSTKTKKSPKLEPMFYTDVLGPNFDEE